LGYYKTQSDALIALAEYHKNGVDFDVTKLTLGEVYDQWIKRKEQTVSVSTLQTHRVAYIRFGALKDKPIKDIKTAQLQQWLDSLDLKPGTKGRVRSTMYQLFEYALNYDIVQKNYAHNLEIAEKVEKTGSIFTNDEIKTLWEHSEDQTVQCILILIYTGMRIGELLEIKKNKIYLEDSYMIGGNKTKAGKNRVIPIHDKIKPILEHNLKQGNYIMNSRQGGGLTYQAMFIRFNKTMEELGMKHKIHDARKTAVSLMHNSGIPMETVRIIVGHSGKGITESVYLFIEPNELVKSINKIEIPYEFVTCL
jgi:integrase